MAIINYHSMYITKIYITNYRGGWDTEGVTVVSNDMNSSTITCSSFHLTSFAVLVDVSAGHQVASYVV